jgi:hypothetical protein
MKTKLLAMMALLVIASTAMAQVNFGAKAGLNLYKVSVDEGDATDMKAGMHVGLLAHIHMSDQIALQPELVYSMQGAKSEFDGDELKLNLDYINIPLLLQYMFDNGFRLEAGPQIGILTSAKMKAGGNSVDVKDSFNSIDFGIPLGVGYISDSGFGADLRYVFGLSNINESDDVKSSNRGLQLGVFYQFNND